MTDLIHWFPFILFPFLCIGAMVAEVVWLTRKGWATPGRAVGYVAATDLLGFSVGSFVFFVIFFIMFMMVMGPAGRGSDVPESVYVVSTIIAIIFPPIILVISKRLFLLIFKIRSGKPAWIYSVLSTILIIIIIFIPPALILIEDGDLPLWK